MNRNIASATSILIVVALTACASKGDLTDEQRVEELRRDAVLADEQRDARQEVQYRQAAHEQHRERVQKNNTP
jgi:predicted small lipoprotein YifL